PGVYAWQRKRPRKDGKPVGRRELIPDFDGVQLAGRPVYLVFDSDAATNPNVGWAEWHLAGALRERGARVKVVRLPHGPPGPDGKPTKIGLDDFFVAGGSHAATALRGLMKAARPPAKPKLRRRAADDDDDRPEITITVEEHDVNSQAAGVLERDPDLYQRGGLLVRVGIDASPAAGVIRRPAAPRIEPLAPATLRDTLTRTARGTQLKETNDGPVKRSARPPAWSVNAVHARGVWPGVRYLEAVTEYPVLRPDGTVLTTAGYDQATGLLYCPAGDVRAAVAELMEAVTDFPFARPAHRSAWLAALLTPPARFAFEGPAPLFLADANTRGT